MKKVLLLLLLFAGFIARASDPPPATIVYTGHNDTFTNTGNFTCITADKSTSNAYTYSYNSLVAANAAGYLLLAGDELVATSNHKLDNAVIIGNYFNYNGPTSYNGESSITHGLFTGYQSNVVIKYNYIERVPMAIIRKSNGYADTDGGITYNIIKSPLAVGVVCKGMSGVRIYNNTFYSDQPTYTGPTSGTWRGLIDIYENDSPASVSGGPKIKNNIFYTKYQIYNIKIDQASCLTGFESDYNIFYCESGTPMFSYLGSAKTFAQWQALGYDQHSVVINPNFESLTSLKPKARLNYGIDLGSAYNTGLSVTAGWVVGSAPATAVQNGSWQVGAHVYAAAAPLRRFYVSVTGSNTNPGTIDSPWLTIQYGVTHISAGDTLFIRGGTYSPATTISHSMYCGVVIDGIRGSASAMYHVMNYPGEVVILDGSAMTGTSYEKSGIYLYSAAYWHFKGITVQKIQQSTGGLKGYGVFLQGGNHNLIENCSATVCGGPGFQTRTPDGDGNTFLNCDSYLNFDAYTATPGDDADGFDFGFGSSTYHQYANGCRAYLNGDDGFDLYQASSYSGYYHLTNCWAWHNGYRPDGTTAAGNGCGFKLGSDPLNTYTAVRRFIIGCIAYDNRTRGFSQEAAQVLKVFYNNFAHRNQSHGFSFYGYDVKDTLRNNISYGNIGDPIEQLGTTRISDHNSWDASTGVSVSAADFVSLDGGQLSQPRQSNGNLPIITYGHLASGSDLISKGVRIPGVVFDCDGNAYKVPPSLGPFEFISASPPHSTLGKLIKSSGKLIIKK